MTISLVKVVLIKFWNGQDARSTEKIIFVEKASCLFLAIFVRGLLMTND